MKRGRAPSSRAFPERVFLLEGEPLTAFRPAPPQHDAAVLGAHPHEEPVCPFPAAIVGLKRSFHRLSSRGDLAALGSFSLYRLGGTVTSGRFAEILSKRRNSNNIGRFAALSTNRGVC